MVSSGLPWDISNGFITQFGHTTKTGSGTYDITYPISMNAYAIQVQERDPSCTHYRTCINSNTITGFVCYTTSNAALGHYWAAIGLA